MSASSYAIRQALESNLQEQRPLLSQLHELQGQEQQLRRRLAEAEVAEQAAPSLGGSSDDWSGEFPTWDATVDSTLSSCFGHGNFRPLQREVINATLSGRDCFAILPTGAGKSLLFQLPGMIAQSGLTVVVSPLVALMTDQLASLKAKGVHAALLASDVTSREETTLIQQQAADPKRSGLRFLYVTPERVAKSKLLISRLQKAYLAGGLSRITIDEAHCAAAQGHDFRPDYLSLGILRSSFPSVPILALTATASDAVRTDVERTLGLDPSRVVRFRGHFDRVNIRYAVRPKPATEEGLLDEMASFCRGEDAAASGRPAGRLPGIVYTLSRADAEKVQAGLSQRRVACAAYHAGCDTRTRDAVQAAWHAGRLQVVVATVAFGLGIDKPDVRFVLHHTVSKSLEAYYQESGRAGRDGEQAEAVAWWKPSDYFRLAALTCDSQDRHAAMTALNAAADFCEARSCRRECFATLFRQPLASRGSSELPHARCCDCCTACANFVEHTSQSACANGGACANAEHPQAGRAASSPGGTGRDSGEVAVEVLRVLGCLNSAAAALGVTDGGMAPAKLTAVKLCDKLGSKVRLDGAKLERGMLEHVVLRLVLADAIRIHFAFTAYAVITYLYVRPSLAATLERAPASTAHDLGLPPLARTLAADLLPSPKAPKAAAPKRKLVGAKAAPSHKAKQRKLPSDGESDGDDFVVAHEAGVKEPGGHEHVQPEPTVQARGRAAVGSSTVINLLESDEDEED